MLKLSLKRLFFWFPSILCDFQFKPFFALRNLRTPVNCFNSSFFLQNNNKKYFTVQLNSANSETVERMTEKSSPRTERPISLINCVLQHWQASFFIPINLGSKPLTCFKRCNYNNSKIVATLHNIFISILPHPFPSIPDSLQRVKMNPAVPVQQKLYHMVNYKFRVETFDNGGIMSRHGILRGVEVIEHKVMLDEHFRAGVDDGVEEELMNSWIIAHDCRRVAFTE